MSTTENTEVSQEVKFEALKQEATTLGITFSGNIGYETLVKKVEEHKAKLTEPKTNSLTGSEVTANLKKELHKLVRIDLQVLNPLKMQSPGEYFSVGNSKVGFVKKFIPFDRKFYDNGRGYHVPAIMVDVLKNRMYSKGSPDMRNGVQIGTKFTRVPEFAVTVLPPLTEEELQALALEQRTEGRI